MEPKITFRQPIGLCDMCLRIAGDAAINCPIAQAIRESGVLAKVVECWKRIPMEESNGQTKMS